MIKSFLTAAAVAGLAAFTASSAQATVLLKIGATTITDNGVGDLDPTLGQIVNIAAPLGFTTAINVGTTTTLPSLDLASVDITSTSSAVVVIYLTETDLTKPAVAASWLTQFSGNWSLGAASVEVQTYFDAGNAPFGTTTLLADLTATSTPFALSSTIFAGGGTPFSITEVLTITAGGAGQHFSLDASLIDAPEPASFGLVAAGLVGLAWVRRRSPRA